MNKSPVNINKYIFHDISTWTFYAYQHGLSVLIAHREVCTSKRTVLESKSRFYNGMYNLDLYDVKNKIFQSNFRQMIFPDL